MRRRVAESQKTDDELNNVRASENDYPPQTPGDKSDTEDVDKGQLVVNRNWTPLVVHSGATVQEIRDASLVADAENAVKYLPVKRGSPIAELASKYATISRGELATIHTTPIEKVASETTVADKSVPELATAEHPTVEMLATRSLWLRKCHPRSYRPNNR